MVTVALRRTALALLASGLLLESPSVFGQAKSPDSQVQEPGPTPGAEAERRAGRPRSNSGAAPEDVELRRLEAAVLQEIIDLEGRLRRLRTRLEAFLKAPPGSAGPTTSFPPDAVPDAPGGRSLPLREEEREAESRLLARQTEILKEWGKVRRDGGPPAEREQRVARLRSQLIDVLDSLLRLRDAARQRRLEALRQELDSLEQALQRRKDKRERRRVVEERATELLEEAPPAPQSPTPRQRQ